MARKTFRIARETPIRVTKRGWRLNANPNSSSESLTMNHVAQNLAIIRDRIAATAASCGRSPEEITLLAISKTFPSESVRLAIDAGSLTFGENRVQEAEAKIRAVGSVPGLEWHLVGHLQTNKARVAAELFDMVQSVDSVKLALKLNQSCLEIGKVLPVLLQVDLGGEETKFGAEPSRIRELVQTIADCRGLRLDGLMTIPPFFDNPLATRPYFARLRQLSESLESEQPGCLGAQHLSMGMSHDFEEAIREGATIVRIGSAIFGSRQYSQ